MRPVFPRIQSPEPNSQLDIVRLAARAFERDRYLSALLAPRNVREDLIALAAFAGELARIPGTVSQPMIGEIRLQWWRDAIAASLADNAATADHPVLEAVAGAARHHRLPASLLADMIDAQSARLESQPFADLRALSNNIARWDGSQFRLTWRILAGAEAGDDPPLLAVAGAAYGFARVLVEAPAELALGRTLLPADMMAAHGVSLESVGPGAEVEAGWRALSATLTARTLELSVEAAPSFPTVPKAVRLAALPYALVRPYLRACERTDIAALQMRDIGPLTRVWRLWLAHRTGRV